MATTRTQIQKRLRKIRGERVVVLKSPRYPLAIENEYRRGMRSMVAITRREINAFIEAELGPILARNRARLPGVRFDDAEDDQNQIMNRIRNAFALGFSIAAMTELPGRVLTKMDEKVFGQMRAQIRSALGQDILNTPQARELLRKSISSNVDKISGLSQRSIAEIESIVDDALRKGLSSAVVAKKIRKRVSVAMSRAEQLAADQMLTARADMIRIRRQESGLHIYRLRTQRDSNVRARHAFFDGTIQDYRNPPPMGPGGSRVNPGEDHHCRCEGDVVITLRR